MVYGLTKGTELAGGNKWQTSRGDLWDHYNSCFVKGKLKVISRPLFVYMHLLGNILLVPVFSVNSTQSPARRDIISIHASEPKLVSWTRPSLVPQHNASFSTFQNFKTTGPVKYQVWSKHLNNMIILQNFINGAFVDTKSVSEDNVIER